MASFSLRSILDSVMVKYLGWESKDFTYTVGETPLSSPVVPIAGSMLYLASIFVLQKLIKKPFPRGFMKKIQIIHNLNLVLISLGLFLLVAENIIPKVFQKGLMWSICDHDSFADNSLVFFYYLNYVSKFLELLDTIFLVMMKKELLFLHVYHHTLTMALCYVEIGGGAAVVPFPPFRTLEFSTRRLEN